MVGGFVEVARGNFNLKKLNICIYIKPHGNYRRH